MSASVCFEYGGYHFFPLRRFAKGEGDFFALSKRLESDPSVGLSEYKERQKFPYSYDDFYKAATNPNYDIFCCVENGKSYVPATRELFVYHNPSEYTKREARIIQNRMLIDTNNQRFDMQQIDNRRFMFNPKTGVLLLGVQYKPSKKIYGSHAEDLANARIYCGFDDYVRGWVGTGKDYPHGVIHFAPNVDDRNAALSILRPTWMTVTQRYMTALSRHLDCSRRTVLRRRRSCALSANDGNSLCFPC